jgi:hypothetical protein
LTRRGQIRAAGYLVRAGEESPQLPAETPRALQLDCGDADVTRSHASHHAMV